MDKSKVDFEYQKTIQVITKNPTKNRRCTIFATVTPLWLFTETTQA